MSVSVGIKKVKVEISKTGTKDENLATCLLAQVMSIATHFFQDSATYEQYDWEGAALTAYQQINPQNELEAMLAAQMVGNHLTAMKCYERAAISAQPTEIKDMYLKHAAKLSRIYIEQVTALNKLRGNNRQKVTVEHIHIHEGGQAIVGNVNSSGVGVKTNIEEQVHAKQITHAPEQKMPCTNKKKDHVPVTSND